MLTPLLRTGQERWQSNRQLKSPAITNLRSSITLVARTHTSMNQILVRRLGHSRLIRSSELILDSPSSPSCDWAAFIRPQRSD